MMQHEDFRLHRLAEMIHEETALTEGNASSEWSHRAVGHVYRCLKRHGTFDIFFDALSRQDNKSPCCPGSNEKLPSNMGRVNLFVLRLFRFPTVRHETQIRSSAACRFPIGDKSRKVACMNPFHYRLANLPRLQLAPIVVNTLGEFGVPPERPENPMDDQNNDDLPEMEDDEMKNLTDEERVKEFKVPNVTMRGDEIKMLYERYSTFLLEPQAPKLPEQPNPSGVVLQPNNRELVNMHDLAQMYNQMNLPGTSMSQEYPQHNQLVYPSPPPVYGAINYQPPPQYSPPPGYSAVASMSGQSEPPQMETPMSGSMISLASTSIPYFPSGNEENYYRSGLSSPASDIESPRVFRPSTSVTGPAVPIHRAMDEVMERDLNREQVEVDVEAMDLDDPHRGQTPVEPVPLYRSSPSELLHITKKAVYECVEYEEKEKWLALIYYEESLQIGEVRSFTTQHCLVDGYCSAYNKDSSNRFSIGYYNNPRRSDKTSEVRSMIGKGVRLYLLAGEVYVENLSSVPVFVQSISANMKNGFALNTVSKLPPTSTMKVFDMRQFSKQLAAAADLTYQDVYALSRMCTIRVSFVKGWGHNYRRSSVLRSPVWFQAHLYNPMAWIDSVLLTMGAPPRLCTSRT